MGEREKIWLSDKEYMFADDVTPSTPEMLPAADADLTGGAGREFRAIRNALQDGRYVVAELTDGGTELRITQLERWQALAIVAILHPPFEE